MFNFKNIIHGLYKIEARNIKTGNSRILADWFSNIVTDTGLNYVNNNFMDYCQIGVAADLPLITDTTLGRYLTNKGSPTKTRGNYGAGNYWVGYTRAYFSFAAGTIPMPGSALVDIAELGVSSSSSGNLFSKTRTVDAIGVPTIIPVLIDEDLNITYELRLTPPLTDLVGSIVLDNIEYNYTVRAVRVGTQGTTTGWSVDQSTPGWANMDTLYILATNILVDVSGIPGTTGSEIGIASNSRPTNTSAYSTFTVGTTYTSAINGFSFKAGMGEYQLVFDTPLPKNNTNVLTLGLGWSWDRI